MRTLNETIEISGEWWLPEKRDKVVPGQLHFSSQGIELYLNEVFSPLTGAIRTGDPNPKYAVVHGTTVKGEAVTLFDAQQFGTSINFGSGGMKQPERIFARVLAFGAHLPQKFQFLKVSFRVPGLQVWLGRKVIMRQETVSQDNNFATPSYRLAEMPAETFRIPSIKALASWHYGWNSTVDDFSSIKVDVSAWFSFQPDNGMPIDWFLAQHETLLRMLSFLAGHPLVADAIQGKFDESNYRTDILFVTRSTEQPKQTQPVDFFLSRSTISKPLEEYCKKWFELAPKVEKPALLARSVMASKGLWIHMEFLSLIQALEGLHRALFDGNYMDDLQYEVVKKDLIKAISETVQKDHRDALISRIKYGNQISLRKRLGELASSLSPNSRARVLGQPDVVPRSWIDTRNYYTHWDDELLPNVLDSQSMYYANVRMHHFIRVLYAQLMGVPVEDIEHAFDRPSQIAQQLVKLNIIEKRQADPTYVPQPYMTISSAGEGRGDEKVERGDSGENSSQETTNE